MIPGLLEVVSVGLVVSACLAIFLDEAVYSVAALAGTFVLTSLLYAFNGAIYVAVFQFAVAIGTLSILFLSGEMLSEKPITKTRPTTTAAVAVLGGLLALPALLFQPLSQSSSVATDISLGDALWNFSAVGVVLQGLVILTVALGITIVLHERKKRTRKTSKQAGAI
jgi:NADH:ubiquinone oxidoreductase subunit 6 (subunit J)